MGKSFQRGNMTLLIGDRKASVVVRLKQWSLHATSKKAEKVPLKPFQLKAVLFSSPAEKVSSFCLAFVSCTTFQQDHTTIVDFTFRARGSLSATCLRPGEVSGFLR